MVKYDAKLVKELRDITGAGMLDCKAALQDSEGNIDKAIEYLRKKGIMEAGKKTSRIAAEGMVSTYIHGGGKIGVMLEVNCETDFVARTDEFKELCKDLAIHICANNPIAISADEIDPALIEKEREIYTEQAKENNEDIDIEAKIKKFIQSSSLLSQRFLKDTNLTIEEYIASKIATTGENIKIRRFQIYRLGEGLEKKQENFAEEVMKQINK